MTRIALWAIAGGCLAAVLGGAGPSGRRVAGAEPAAVEQAIPGSLPPDLQAVRESLGGSVVEHYPSLRPPSDALSPWKSLSWFGAGAIRSVLVDCGLQCEAAAEPTEFREPAALPPAIAPAAALPPSVYAPTAWPSTGHAAMPVEWAAPAASVSAAAPVDGPALMRLGAPAAPPFAVAQVAEDGDSTPVSVLRSTARQLDETANQLEEMELYGQADALREVAQKLRVDARSLATPTLVPSSSGGPILNADPTRAPSEWTDPAVVDGVQPTLAE